MNHALKSVFFAAAAVGVALTAAVPTPAEAKVLCVYKAEDTKHRMITGSASHKKGSVACDRARRECNRNLKWAHRKAIFGRTLGCIRSL